MALPHMYVYIKIMSYLHIYKCISICIFVFSTETFYISHVNNFMGSAIYIQVNEIYVLNMKHNV